MPRQGLDFEMMFNGIAYGHWLIWAELVPFTLLPLILLGAPRLRARPGVFPFAALLACAGLILNRYTTNMLTLAGPTFPFESWELYWPNFIEIAPVLMAVGIFILTLLFLYKQGILVQPSNK